MKKSCKKDLIFIKSCATMEKEKNKEKEEKTEKALENRGVFIRT